MIKDGALGTSLAIKHWILRLQLYRLAAWLYEGYRFIAQPSAHGALVALWHQKQILLISASYRRELSLPGGWINKGESARQAAQRELVEELSLEVEERELGKPWTFSERTNRGSNTVSIFSIELKERPTIQVDGLEILDWIWLTEAEALKRPITGHLCAYLLRQRVP